MRTSGPALFFLGKFLTTNAISLKDVGLLELSILFWVSFGSLCLSRNLSISSKLSKTLKVVHNVPLLLFNSYRIHSGISTFLFPLLVICVFSPFSPTFSQPQVQQRDSSTSSHKYLRIETCLVSLA